VLTVSPADVVRMRDQLFFEGQVASTKLTRFWVLLGLSAVIASAGVVGDSTATVIGAMIVAPLMTPILGTALALAIGDVRNLVWCVGLVVTGAISVICIGVLLALVVPVDVVAATSSQVAGRVSPRLIDLLAALATGAVGAFALVRQDISDTLPGVAIAISLVPPLAVVGITLEAGAEGQAGGALLLFLTNVGAILLSGLAVMALYRVRRTAHREAPPAGGRVSVAVVVAFVVILIVPLSASSGRIARYAFRVSDVTAAAQSWADPAGWRIVSVDVANDAVVVHAAGGLPVPEPRALRAALDDAGLGEVDVRLILTPEDRVELPAGAP
jgi:uncharacterized hydrophobic protein (TIGR00271 family)